MNRRSRSGWVFWGLLLLTSCGTPQEAIHPLLKEWEQPFPRQEVPAGLSSLRAEECGACHREIYLEWQGSTHANAFVDLQFQKEWAKDEHLFVCQNCHAPLENQQASRILGLRGGDYWQAVEEPNPDFDPELQKEGITCAVCHVRDGAVVGPYGGDDAVAPHAVVGDPEFLSSQTCVQCHDQQDVLSATLVCTFTTGLEWNRGPYAGGQADCLSCHMPVVYRPNAEGHPVRESNRHTWPGAGIAKFPDEEAQARRDLVSGLAVRIAGCDRSYTVGDELAITVEVRNQFAGHDVPTGDVERFVEVHLELLDRRGRVLASRSERIGEEWQWWPEAKQISDNSLHPLEARTYVLDRPASEEMIGGSFRARVVNHRMTEKIAREMDLFGSYPLASEVRQLECPLRVEPAPQNPFAAR